MNLSLSILESNVTVVLMFTERVSKCENNLDRGHDIVTIL